MNPNELPVLSPDRLKLYHFMSCPFCMLVRTTIDRLGIQGIEYRDIHQSRDFAEELLDGGGKTTVPCLRMDLENGETFWLYESQDIVTYLQRLTEAA